MESQESVLSTISSTFSAPALPSTSSNLSSDYDAASPTAPNGSANHEKFTQESMPASSRMHDHFARGDVPLIDTAAANAPQYSHTTTTPMPLISPTTQGFKRSADGSVKGSGSATSPIERVFAHKRNKSMDTHSSSRIGEVCDRILRHLYTANAYAAIRTTEDPSFVCYDQSTKWMGEAVA